ncbi:MAG: surface lipoprotein assembly modifier [Sphingobium sp.]|nr:surface lipoprotein assembly modifier [Sphingobium sp.]
MERKVPDAIKAAGISFEGGINRRIALGGHSGLRGRTIFFGDIYPEHHDFSQATIITRLGYDYQTARDGLAISPSFDLGTLGSSTLYRAWGLNAEWTHIFSSKVMARLEANHRKFDYLLAGYQSQDGPLTDIGLTTWYVPARNWTLFAGLDFSAKDAPLSVDSYHQWGARLGVNKAFGQSASIMVIGSYRRRDFRAYSELFEAQRSDDQFNATVIARFPILKFAALTPEVVVQHNRVESNIDWLYSYKRTIASVRLSRAF